MLEAHLNAMQQVEASTTNGVLKFFCKPISVEQREQLLKDSKNWETCYEISKDKVMAFQPVYDNKDVLRTVRFISDAASTAKRRAIEMEKELSDAQPLESWLLR